MTFRVGVTSDLKTASGEPCFNIAAFDELKANPDIEWEWLPHCDRISARMMASYDALQVNLPLVGADAVAGDDLRVKLIARNGVGFDTVDVGALAARGVMVTNTPLAIRRPVAVAALSLILALAGKLPLKDKLVRTGRWNERVEHMGLGLTGRTLGIVGAGGIGAELARLAAPFFANVIAADPFVAEADMAGAIKRNLPDLLAEADMVAACCMLNDATHHLMNAEAFAAMKPGALFFNVGRGPIHDERALIAALQSGHLGGAGLDVTEIEPIALDNPLLTMENTIITAHALCWTDECFEDIARTALRSIVDVSQGRHPPHVVQP
jgi:phosphoglycerate dehydrogenase-like enzyme